MAKLTLNTISSRYGSIDALNDNFNAIEAAIENTLSLDGTSPNAMEVDLDMNNQDILNIGEANMDTLRINGVLVEPTIGVTAGTVFQTYEYTATAGQTTFSVSPATPYNSSIVVIVNGLQLSPAEVSVSSTNVLIPAMTLGDEVVIRRYTAKPVAAPDASEVNFIQSGTGAVTRTSQAKMREFVSVKDFGAVGDGSTDDTAALQAAVNSGGAVIIPAGMNCRITAEIVFNLAGTTLTGYGATITKSGTFATARMLRIDAPDVRVEGFYLNGVDKVIDGISTAASTCSGFTAKALKIRGCLYGISANSNSDVLIEGCDIAEIASGGIRCHNIAATEVNRNIRVIDCDINLSDLNPATSLNVGLLIRGTTTYMHDGVEVSRNRFTHCTAPANSGAVNCEIRWSTNASFSDNKAVGGSMAVSIAGCTDSLVDANTCRGQSFYAIEVASPDATVPMSNISVTGNTIDGIDVCKYGVGFQGLSYSVGGTVSGNSIRRVSLYGVFFSLYWNDCAITGNRIDASIATGTQYGIYVNGTTSVGVSNYSICSNILNGNSQGEKAIYVRGVSDVAIAGNSCPGWTQNGVYIDGNTFACTNVSVTGNQFGALSNTAIGYAGTIVRVSSYSNPGYRRSNTSGSNDVDLTSNTIDAWGTGSPEGLVTAGIGSFFRRTNGGASTTLYIKESGTGNTGWRAV